MNSTVDVTTTVEVSGTKTTLWRSGAGRPLLFLHPGDGLTPHVPLLERLSKSYQVWAPAHPGFDGSHKPDHVRTTDDLAYYYLNFLEEMDLRDVIVVGPSFGGWIAAEISTKNSSRIAGLVFSGTLGCKFKEPRNREILDLFSIPQYELDPYFYWDKEKSCRDYSVYTDEYLEKLAQNHATFALFGWSPTLHNPKLRHRLERIQPPALVIWGANDMVVSSEYGQEFASRLPNAEFEIVLNSGHYVHLEQMETYVGLVEDFTNKLSRIAA